MRKKRVSKKRSLSRELSSLRKKRLMEIRKLKLKRERILKEKLEKLEIAKLERELKELKNPKSTALKKNTLRGLKRTGRGLKEGFLSIHRRL